MSGHGVVGAGKCRMLVDPVLERQVVEPPVSGTAVVGYDVLNKLDALLMSGGHQRAVQFVGAVAGVDLIVVRAGIAVVGIGRLVVEGDGRRPYGGDAEVGQIVQMIHDALEVTAVTSAGELAVALLGGQGRGVILHVPVGETVGHQQVHHIGGAEAHPLAGALAPLVNAVGKCLSFPVGIVNRKIIFARSQVFRYLQIHEEVVGALGIMHGLDRNPVRCHGYIRARKSGSVQHQGQRSLHSGPPAGRLHAQSVLRTGGRGHRGKSHRRHQSSQYIFHNPRRQIHNREREECSSLRQYRLRKQLP